MFESNRWNNLGGEKNWRLLPEIAEASELGWYPDFERQMYDGLSGFSYAPDLKLKFLDGRPRRFPNRGERELWNDAVRIFTQGS